MRAFLTCGTEETRKLGGLISEELEPGDVLALTGELGSGKTTLIQGIMRGLGFKNRVQSPSFILVRTYEARLQVKHVDLYRLDSAAVDELHLDEIYDEKGIMLVEWAERADGYPGTVSNIEIIFDAERPDSRRIIVTGPLEERLR